MTDRCKPTSYLFKADGVKATIEDFDEYWKVYFTRATTADSEDHIDYIEKTQWQTLDFAVGAIESLISERRRSA